MTVLIDNLQDKHSADNLIILAESAVVKAIEFEGLGTCYQVSMIFVDNEKIREINRIHRGIDRPTDVLSFPMLDDDEAYDEENFEELDMDTGEVILGDIVISVERAFEQSIEYGHSLEREIAFLTVHGILHLLGYDHETDDERKLMREREESILEQLRLQR